MRDFSISVSNGQPGHDSERDKHHCAATLQYFRSLRRDLRDRECPSTAELTRDGRFGLRPPNRINDLIHGKFDGHHYDFERIKGNDRGEYRWRLHEPARPGYPKPKDQAVLPIEPADRPDAHRQPASHPWKQPFSTRRMAEPLLFEINPRP